jgi:hypothetical protein
LNFKNLPEKTRLGVGKFFEWQFDIFLVFPHLKSQWRGEAQSRGEREIRDEVSFQASEG